MKMGQNDKLDFAIFEQKLQSHRHSNNAWKTPETYKFTQKTKPTLNILNQERLYCMYVWPYEEKNKWLSEEVWRAKQKVETWVGEIHNPEMEQISQQKKAKVILTTLRYAQSLWISNCIYQAINWFYLKPFHIYWDLRPFGFFLF